MDKPLVIVVVALFGGIAWVTIRGCVRGHEKVPTHGQQKSPPLALT